MLKLTRRQFVVGAGATLASVGILRNARAAEFTLKYCNNQVVTHPMNIRMAAVRDFTASGALVAGVALRRRLVSLFPALTIESLGQRARQLFKLSEMVSGKQVRMGQPPALQRTLQQLHTLLLFRRVFECHCRVK